MYGISTRKVINFSRHPYVVNLGHQLLQKCGTPFSYHNNLYSQSWDGLIRYNKQEEVDRMRIYSEVLLKFMLIRTNLAKELQKAKLIITYNCVDLAIGIDIKAIHDHIRMPFAS